MNAFLDSVDLSTNIQRGLAAIRGIYGIPALILGVALGAICIALAPLIWYFDLDATLDATAKGTAIILPSLPADVAQWLTIVSLCLTLLPTLIELFGARFAAIGIRVASGLVYFFSAFDAITDWPRVESFMAAYRDAFNGLGFFAEPVFIAVRSLFLFMASFGFEVVFVVFLICAIALIFQSRMGQRQVAGA